jgi:hypothetical protein
MHTRNIAILIVTLGLAAFIVGSAIGPQGGGGVDRDVPGATTDTGKNSLAE